MTLQQALEHDVKIGVIGGSGLYHVEEMELLHEVHVDTPWGAPSDSIRICMHKHHGCKIAFLARHGRGHPLNPSEINNRANVAALKKLGVEVILAFSAVGSLREEIRPLDFVVPNQVVDRTKGIRAATFFENGCVGHVEFADPFCEEIAQIVKQHRHVLEESATAGPRLHFDKTLVVMEGPAFSTRAESHMYRSWGCDIINMSTLPEAKLAREAEIPYAVICMATDYDCWREVPGEDVSVEAVIKTLKMNGENAKKLLVAILPDLERGLSGTGRGAVRKGQNKFACITAPGHRSAEQVRKLDFILPGYFGKTE